ncbi:MAG: hypothetical protein BYD32DRAFT_190839 [Podila humilis]|nr:MAG: hypothetical protein BYD32DRAFT_190839 [Podila humilis]
MIQIESGVFVFQGTLSNAKRYFGQFLFTIRRFSFNLENARKILIDFGASSRLILRTLPFYFLRGQNYIFSGQPQAASEDFQKAVELDPNYEKAHAHHINAIADTGEVRKALAMLKDLTEKFPNSCFIYNAYAKVLCMNKQYEAAMKGTRQSDRYCTRADQALPQEDPNR